MLLYPPIDAEGLARWIGPLIDGGWWQSVHEARMTNILVYMEPTIKKRMEKTLTARRKEEMEVELPQVS